MKVIVVYESHWGNTASVAKAIAEGFGPEAEVLTTDEASPAAVADADLIIAGAPVMAFSLPSDKMLATIAGDAKAPSPPDLSHPSMRSWLDQPAGRARTFGPIRDRAPVVAGRRDRCDRPQARRGGLQATRKVTPFRRQRIVRPAPRGRTGTRPTVGNRACRGDDRLTNGADPLEPRGLRDGRGPPDEIDARCARSACR